MPYCFQITPIYIFCTINMLPPQILCAYWPWVYLTWTTTQCAITGFMSLPVGLSRLYPLVFLFLKKLLVFQLLGDLRKVNPKTVSCTLYLIYMFLLKCRYVKISANGAFFISFYLCLEYLSPKPKQWLKAK
jgi:hypothetical protein